MRTHPPRHQRSTSLVLPSPSATRTKRTCLDRSERSAGCLCCGLLQASRAVPAMCLCILVHNDGVPTVGPRALCSDCQGTGQGERLRPGVCVVPEASMALLQLRRGQHPRLTWARAVSEQPSGWVRQEAVVCSATRGVHKLVGWSLSKNQLRTISVVIVAGMAGQCAQPGRLQVPHIVQPHRAARRQPPHVDPSH